MALFFKIVCWSEDNNPPTPYDWRRSSEGEQPSYALRDWGEGKDKAKALRAEQVNSITLKPEAKKMWGVGPSSRVAKDQN
ncbi:hypothetical protein CEXT_64831 [Caerostris extrusa]|uniref:Uncharacterized protein n=1 Tax=Caerostris extrusa TaxID=172846 RepID=A0AAV4N6X1_CAEEX|nr:hypothetical protein CEXT_64831 [Caerostris extrusa]